MTQKIALTAVCAVLVLGLASCHHHGHHHDRETRTRYEISVSKPGARPVSQPGKFQPQPQSPRR